MAAGDKKSATSGKQTRAAGSNRTRPLNNPNYETPESNSVVSVGCKLPHGIHLDIRELGQPTKRVTIKGINSLQTGLIRVSTIGGFAVTENVPKEFFHEWMRRNAEHSAVRNKLIFAHDQLASVRSMGEEFEGQQTGLEPINPHKLPNAIQNRTDND